MPLPPAESLRQRMAMVDRDLRARGIRDRRVLAAFEQVPRDLFVDAAWAHAAYDDTPLPIGLHQTISQPYVVARMLELARLRPSDRVLDVGTGSGYAAALAGVLVREVHSIERLRPLADAARTHLAAAGITNVTVHAGDGSRGLPAHAPYDAIVVAAAAPAVPDALCQQLAPGGRLVLPVGAQDGEQVLTQVTRTEAGTFTTVTLEPVRFVPLVGAAAFGPA